MPQIAMKEAVARAKAILNDLYAEEKLDAVAVEEIELVREEGVECWAVTMGFYRPKSVTVRSGAIGAMFQPSQIENRDYKKLFINSATGDFLRMEIRPMP